MDDISIGFWVVAAALGYAFHKPFRQWVNGIIVSLADTVRNDVPSKPEPVVEDNREDAAFAWYKADHPDDQRDIVDFRTLPHELRSLYVKKAAFGLPPEAKTGELREAAADRG